MGFALEMFGSITDGCRRLFSPPKLPVSYSKDSDGPSPWCEAEHSPASDSNLKDVWG
jgi:hypothetical protein